MKSYVDEVIKSVSVWEAVTLEPHRFGGHEFRVGNMEIGHIHNHGLVDVPFTRRIREQLVTENAAQEHHILPETGWISFYIRSEADIVQAIWLLRLSYLHKQRNRNRRMLGQSSTFEKELEQLSLSAELRAILN